MNKRILLKDISEKVGVSTALVSYVLNGQEKEKRVGSEIAKKIHQVAKELHYQPNQIARSLKSGKTNTIGLLISDISNPFSGQIARFIEREATNMGYTLIIGSTNEDKSKFTNLIESMLSKQVDGLIAAPVDNSGAQLKMLVKKSIPLVCIDRYIPTVPTNFVVLDNYNSTYNVVKLLISQGRRNICLIVYRTSAIHMTERTRGYIDAMKESNLEGNLEVVEIPRKVYFQVKSDTEKIMDNILINKKVDAIIFAANALSIYGLYAIKKHKIKVPDEMAVIGFDGHEVFDFFEPPISFVKQPLEEMGTESVRILVNQINGETKIVQKELKHQFIENN